MDSSRQRQVAYAATSFLLGAWAMIQLNAITGPAFEPIVEACRNPDISFEEFASKTGYHEYDARVGLKVFNVLICVITQFFLELRESHPAGLLGWGGVVVVFLSTNLIFVTESGREGARGPIRYPTIMGLLYNIFGISVVFPLLWVPSFVFGEGTRGSPLTRFRVLSALPLMIPVHVLLAVLFLAPTESRLWTTCAGILGGPILPLGGLCLVADKSSELKPMKETVQTTSSLISSVHKITMVLGFVGWYCWVAIAVRSYGASIGDLWDDLWVRANPSVKFMTIDMIVLYLAYLIFVAYRCGESKAAKALLLTVALGPSAACSLVLMETEDETEYAGRYPEDDKKND